jgi:hypothetical protein
MDLVADWLTFTIAMDVDPFMPIAMDLVPEFTTNIVAVYRSVHIAEAMQISTGCQSSGLLIIQDGCCILSGEHGIGSLSVYEHGITALTASAWYNLLPWQRDLVQEYCRVTIGLDPDRAILSVTPVDGKRDALNAALYARTVE